MASANERGGTGPGSEMLVRHVKQTLFGAGLAGSGKNTFTICFLGDGSGLSGAFDGLAESFETEVKMYSPSSQPFVKVKTSLQGKFQREVMDNAFSMALKEKGKNTLFNFRRNEFRKLKRRVSYWSTCRAAAVPLIAAVVIAVAYMGYDYRKVLYRQKMLKQQIVSVFRETLPNVKRIVSPVRQLQAEINELKKTYKNNQSDRGYSIVQLLTEISVRVPLSCPVVVKRMIIDVDAVRIRAITSDFNAVDNIQKDLEKSTYFQDVVISSASQSTDGDGVRFELKLNLFRQSR
jgi:Tfp pilus assembly protein PilN